jgi:hypothetical protein
VPAPRTPLAPADDLLDLLVRRLLGDPERLQRLGCYPAALMDEGEQYVLGADVVVLSILASSWARTTVRRAWSVNLSNMLTAALLILVFGPPARITIHLVYRVQ